MTHQTQGSAILTITILLQSRQTNIQDEYTHRPKSWGVRGCGSAPMPSPPGIQVCSPTRKLSRPPCFTCCYYYFFCNQGFIMWTWLIQSLIQSLTSDWTQSPVPLPLTEVRRGGRNSNPVISWLVFLTLVWMLKLSPGPTLSHLVSINSGVASEVGLGIHLPEQEMQEMRVRSLSREDPLEKGMATHSSILPEKFHWQMSLVGYSPCSWGCKEWDTAEDTHTYTHRCG